jgi:ABC-type branched-subunit amino acid transport system permease subunit
VSDSTPEYPVHDGVEGPPLRAPAIGHDEWVARHVERRLPPQLGTVEERLRLVPWWAWLVLFLGAACLLPVFSSSGYVRYVGFSTVLYMLLALGLNVVVGWGGLLDLGFVAFYGIGAYAYALLDSDHYGIHMWSVLSIPLIVVLGGVAGLLLGLPSRRLSGDYLAIVTLFFLQLFQTLTTNGDQFLFGAGNVTGGANGILRIDPLDLFGKELAVQHGGAFAVGYYFVALAFFAVVFVALRLVNHSRTGRAWRSQREDALAAEVMGMPVNWLKLMSFAFGAATAALAGTLFASLNAAVFPLEFYFVLLITVYTMVILGGQGSQAGVVLGAIIVSVLLELLRDPGHARDLFYILLGAGLLIGFKFSWKLLAVAGGLVAFGFAAHEIARAIDPSWVSGTAGGWASDWVIVPQQLASWVAPVTYIGLIAAVLGLTLLHGWVRTVLLVPVLYLAAFVWENVMLAKPEPTRYIVIGVILVALMILRPNGLLGERRVEII